MLLFFHYLAKKSNKKRLLTEDVFWLFTPLLEMPRSQVMGLTTLSDGNGSLERRTRLAPGVGFEPTTKRLTVSCATAALPGKVVIFDFRFLILDFNINFPSQLSQQLITYNP